MADFGGKMRFNLGSTPITIRAKFDLEPTGATYVEEDNQDGSFARYMQPMGPKWDIEFQDSVDGVSARSLNWDAIMRGGPYNATVVEDDTGIVHSFTGLKFLGRPKIDRFKGPVTGITGKCPVGGYVQTTA